MDDINTEFAEQDLYEMLHSLDISIRRSLKHIKDLKKKDKLYTARFIEELEKKGIPEGTEFIIEGKINSMGRYIPELNRGCIYLKVKYGVLLPGIILKNYDSSWAGLLAEGTKVRVKCEYTYRPDEVLYFTNAEVVFPQKIWFIPDVKVIHEFQFKLLDNTYIDADFCVMGWICSEISLSPKDFESVHFDDFVLDFMWKNWFEEMEHSSRFIIVNTVLYGQIGVFINEENGPMDFKKDDMIAVVGKLRKNDKYYIINMLMNLNLPKMYVSGFNSFHYIFR